MPEPATLDKVLVIIPTFNEAENIESIVGRLRTSVPQAHVLVADDNSPDGTGDIADRLADSDDHVHVLHRRGKEGLGKAYLAGFQWGLDNGYDVLVEHDADGSHQPEQLPLLLEALKTADMVKGSRWVPGGRVVNWPKSREVLSRAGNLWTQAWLGIKLKDATGGFNAFRADTLRGIGLQNIEAAGYGFQVDLAWKALQRGFVVKEVPIEFIERERGQSKMSRNIVIEAALLTARWGIAHRLGQLKSLVGGNGQSAGQIGGEQVDLKATASRLAKDAGAKAGELKDKIVDSGVPAKAAELAKDAGKKAGELKDKIVDSGVPAKAAEFAKDAGKKAGELAKDASHKAGELANQAKSKVSGSGK